ncbi:7-deoxyloganetin glucosyltransferase-like isoform X2 [Quercus robur]|uniref:7-deoxyloganetin glucosyltransferase-like isoform X2 n=1 Tax=Quercus robur TaxID=38942 RepID=UPI0021631B56|nr:7-deoxyloganetin glucosyltransferase-like isoform X2 [Quercus robur]
MGSKTLKADKPHAVCIPFPVQSHIKAMLKFSKLLHHKGFHITFVNTEFNHQRFLKLRGPNSLDGLSDFRFETIPDNLPPSDPNASQDVRSLCNSIMKNFLASFSNLLVKLNSATSNVPPVTCIISDGFMQFTINAAQELGIPILMFFTVSACSLMGYMQIPPLQDKGIIPLKDKSYLTNGYLDTVIDWIPGMRGIRLKDLPSEVRTIDPNDVVFKFVIETAERAPTASGIVIQTFDALEQEVLDALLTMFPHVYAIGPLQPLLNHLTNDPLKSIGYSLWEEETECLQWLNSKAPNSVIYVNFGSIVVMTPTQLVEFGWGIANSKYLFLWIIRPDLVVGESAILPPEFKLVTKERGLIASWCPQEEVLNHPSIGGFITHSGWNSTIESVCAGVPMLCWPFLGDQQTNCKYTCNEWGIGMEIDNDVKREEVEKIVKELMEGEKGKKMKKKAMEWKKLAEEATEPLGSSSINVKNLVNEVLLSK